MKDRSLTPAFERVDDAAYDIEHNTRDPQYSVDVDRGIMEDFKLGFHTDLGMHLAEDASFSPFLMNADRTSGRNKKIEEYQQGEDDTKKVPDNVVGTWSYTDRAWYMKHELGMSDIETDEEIQEAVKNDGETMRSYYEEVQATQGLAGMLGGSIGTVFGYAADPWNIPTWLTGGAYGGGYKILKGMLVTGAVEGTVEGLKQSIVTMPHKQGLGLNYGWEDVAIQTAVAAGSATLIEGTLLSIGKGLRVVSNKILKEQPNMDKRIREYLKDYVAEYNDATGPKGETLKEHEQGKSAAFDTININEPKGNKKYMREVNTGPKTPETTKMMRESADNGSLGKMDESYTEGRDLFEEMSKCAVGGS